MGSLRGVFAEGEGGSLACVVSMIVVYAPGKHILTIVVHGVCLVDSNPVLS